MAGNAYCLGYALLLGAALQPARAQDLPDISELKPATHVGGVKSLSFFGHFLASGGYNKSIILWNDVLQHKSQLFGHKGYVSALLVTSDMTKLVSASADTTILIWDLKSKKSLHRLVGHQGFIISISLDKAEAMLASASWDGTIGLWEL